MRRRGNLEIAWNDSGSVFHVLESHSLRAATLLEAFAVVSDGKSNLSGLERLQLDCNLSRSRMFEGISHRLLSNPINMQCHSFIKL